VPVNVVIFLLQALSQILEGEVAYGRPIRIVVFVLQGMVDHIQETFQVPSIQGDGTGTLVGIDFVIEAERFRHSSGVSLQFQQFVTGNP
jgi:hypothetical protein